MHIEFTGNIWFWRTVWYPYDVDPGWRPYADGYWHYGPHGYFWVGAEPWGWGPYHYGRWNWVSPYGWCWAPGSVYAGAGFHYSLHTNVRPHDEGDPRWDDSAYLAYSRQYGFDAYGQTSSGVNLNLTIDTRDNPVNASRGVSGLAQLPAVLQGLPRRRRGVAGDVPRPAFPSSA